MIPRADSVGSGTPFSGRLAPESACVPLRAIVDHQGEFGGEHPPVTLKGEESALNVPVRDVLPLANFAPVFCQAHPQGPFAFGGAAGCLPDIDQIAPEIQGVNSAALRAYALSEVQPRAVFQLLDYLGSDASIKVKIKAVRVRGHNIGILTDRRAAP